MVSPRPPYLCSAGVHEISKICLLASNRCLVDREHEKYGSLWSSMEQCEEKYVVASEFLCEISMLFTR